MIASRGASLRQFAAVPASAIGLGDEKHQAARTTIERACLILSDLKEEVLNDANAPER
jgi:hypothetical protein